MGSFFDLDNRVMVPACQLINFYCEGMQCDCHCQNDCEYEVMILILLQFCLYFKLQSHLVTLTSFSNKLSLTYCMFIPISV